MTMRSMSGIATLLVVKRLKNRELVVKQLRKRELARIIHANASFR